MEDNTDRDEAARADDSSRQGSTAFGSGDRVRNGKDRTYATALRAIGNDLEALQAEVFEMEREGDGFVVRIEQRAAQAGNPPLLSLKGLQSAWRRLVEQPSAQPGDQASEIRYSAEDIETLDREGRERRNESFGLADTYRLSQILRVVGAYVDIKRGRLLGVSVRNGSVSVQYEAGGVKLAEEHRVASLYDFAVNMYLQRAERKS